MPVLLVGTLDTKGIEFAYVRDKLRAAGVAVTVADAGTLGPPAFEPDISRDAVFAAGWRFGGEDPATGATGETVGFTLHLFGSLRWVLVLVGGW